MKKEDRKEQTNNKANRTNEQTGKVRLINRLQRARSQANMTEEQKEKVKSKDRLRKSRDKNQMGRKTRNEHGKLKQINMENGERKERQI